MFPSDAPMLMSLYARERNCSESHDNVDNQAINNHHLTVIVRYHLTIMKSPSPSLPHMGRGALKLASVWWRVVLVIVCSPPHYCVPTAEQLCAQRCTVVRPPSAQFHCAGMTFSFGRSDDQFARKLLLTPAF